ncbi:MAG: HAD superfamily hydrolase (TIGR01509 family) [Rubritalea sp.]|jgi:HAD superfamily hydrolase (TIGR01509 family)
MKTFGELEIPAGSYEAVIFDLDGTLVDSMPAHFAAWSEALAQFNVPKDVFPEDVFYSMGGRPTTDIVVELNGEFGLHLDPADVALAKRDAFMNLLDQVEINEDVVNYARSMRGKVPMAIATGGSRVVAEKTLQAVGISDLFDEVVTANDVKCGKPAADIFIEAANRLDVDPKKCLVLEDAPAGIVAAQSAGMDVVRVSAPFHRVK